MTVSTQNSSTGEPSASSPTHTGIARGFFALTSAVVVFGLALAVWIAYTEDAQLWPGVGFSGRFEAGWGNVANQFAFFTVQSNLILAITCALLAIRPNRTSTAFYVWRLVGLIDVIITGVVTQTLLAPDQPHQGVNGTMDLLVHQISPILAVTGWIVFGPSGGVGLRRIMLAAWIPLTYAVVTLIRGEVIDWYPYSILDVTGRGYVHAFAAIAGIMTCFATIAALLAWADRRLAGLRWRIRAAQ